MKIGVISDTHGVVPAWQQAMEVFDGADLILHAGDVLYHPPRIGFTQGYDIPDLVQVINASPIPIVMARGNCDSEVYEELLDFPVMSPYAVAEIDDLRIVVHHGHTMDAEDMAGFADKYKADILITGHTHIPLIERMGNAIHMNPGSPSHPKFEIDGVVIPTVGLITEKGIQIVELETGNEVMALPLR